MIFSAVNTVTAKEMVSDEPEPLGERTILTESDPEFLTELSEYLDVLASPVRLSILSYIRTRPRTARQVSHHIKSSYQNAQKHLIQLQSLGLIRKEIGMADELENQGQPIFYYVLVPGGLDHTLRSLALFSSVGKTAGDLSERLQSARDGLKSIMPVTGPRLIVTNGPKTGSMYDLNRDIYRVGRIEEGWDGTSPEPAILIPDDYLSVSRVSRPHAWLRRQDGRWTITEGSSKGGTAVNGIPVLHEPVYIRDEDLIELSPGPLGVDLLFQAGIT
ncbi:MAG: helix-turn-helix domain-containing protein [Methanospirillum sp.]|nr:helix-turn-helix domain-containing protein [Methanospirillum sp.]